MESKRKCVVLMIAEKLEVCKATKRGRSLISLATEYGIGKATVHDILKVSYLNISGIQTSSGPMVFG